MTHLNTFSRPPSPNAEPIAALFFLSTIVLSVSRDNPSGVRVADKGPSGWKVSIPSSSSGLPVGS